VLTYDAKECEKRGDLEICDNGHWLHVAYITAEDVERAENEGSDLIGTLGWVNTQYLRFIRCTDEQ
jgi:hypothetical protein